MNQKKCPLCNQSNHCGVLNESSCWCTKVKVTKEMLDEVPKELLGKSCLCINCINKSYPQNE